MARKKLEDKIKTAIAMVLSLNNLKEFEEYERTKLFDKPPEQWTEIEHTINDYTVRISMELQREILSIVK